jgi:hypothetical protein
LATVGSSRPYYTARSDPPVIALWSPWPMVPLGSPVCPPVPLAPLGSLFLVPERGAVDYCMPCGYSLVCPSVLSPPLSWCWCCGAHRPVLRVCACCCSTIITTSCTHAALVLSSMSQSGERRHTGRGSLVEPSIWTSGSVRRTGGYRYTYSSVTENK